MSIDCGTTLSAGYSRLRSHLVGLPPQPFSLKINSLTLALPLKGRNWTKR